MRKLGPILLLALVVALLAAGCTDDPAKPEIRRIHAMETCGVAPLRVEFRVDATGGAPRSDATGGNNWLITTWDLGDGTVVENADAVIYHTFYTPDLYTVVCTVEDDNGDQAVDSVAVWVRADSLTIEVFALLDGEEVSEVETCRPFELGLRGQACDFDSEEDSSERFVFFWQVQDSVYTGPSPRHTFHPDILDGLDESEQLVYLTLLDPATLTTRRDTIALNVVASAGVDLRLSSGWSNTPLQATDSDSLVRDIVVFPDTLVYTVSVENIGQTVGYNVSIAGEIPNNDRLFLTDHVSTAGSFSFDEGANEWLWRIPDLPVGASESVDVHLVLETASKRDDLYFPAALLDYWCDINADDDVVNPVMTVRSALSNLQIEADWGETVTTSNADSLLYSIPYPLIDEEVNPHESAYPSPVTYTVRVRNLGPSDALDYQVRGSLPDDPRVTYQGHQILGQDEFAYDPLTRTWVWEIARTVITSELHIEVALDSPNGNEIELDESFVFPMEIGDYPEDPSPDDHARNATISIVAGISDILLSTTWLDDAGAPLDEAHLLHDIRAFPDSVAVRVVLENQDNLDDDGLHPVNDDPLTDARLLIVQGALDNADVLEFGGFAPTEGTFQYDEDLEVYFWIVGDDLAGYFQISTANGMWSWYVMELPLGESTGLDFFYRFALDIAAGDEFDFVAELPSGYRGDYPGDRIKDVEDHMTEATLTIQSLPE